MDRLFIVAAVLNLAAVNLLLPPAPPQPLPTSLESVLHPPRASLEEAPVCLNPLVLR